MHSLRRWLQETHGPYFELLRHFLLRFFDSDAVSTPGQTAPFLIAALPLVFQWFFLLVLPFRSKYGRLSALTSPEPYRAAVRGDELWLITLMMAAIGLLTALKWQALFPGLLDYRALAGLPLRSRQIFAAKFSALLIVGFTVLLTLNFLPGIFFPVLSSSHWAFNPSLGARIWAHAAASLAGSGFFFFGLIALEGIFLNLFRPRFFARASGNLQGLLVALMLVLLVVSFSIDPKIAAWALSEPVSQWLPQAWFLGLFEWLAADPSPPVYALAQRALVALGIAISLAALTYLLSYHRHRALLMEGAAGTAKDRRFGSWLLSKLTHEPRQQAILSFMMKTLLRSSRHRMILIGYAGVGFALLLTGMAGTSTLVQESWITAANFVYFHLITLSLFLIAARHLFSIPIEWKANWIFQITEGEGRPFWLWTIDRFVLSGGALILFVLPLPLELRLLGLRGLAETGFFLLLGLVVYEWKFSPWEKVPFTCSRLPLKAPVWMVLGVVGLVVAISMVQLLIVAFLYQPLLLGFALAGLALMLYQIRKGKAANWADLPLQFDQLPEPEIRSLGLLR